MNNDDPNLLIKVGQTVVEEHLKQLDLIVPMPDPIVKMMGYMVTSIRQIYNVDWPTAMSFLDRLCMHYAQSVAATLAQKSLDQEVEKMYEEDRVNQSSNNVIDFFPGRVKKEQMN